MNLIKKVRFDRMGAFTYSQEEDTPAADFPNQVDEEIKEERLDRLMTLQQGISLELNKAKLGKTLEVLVEGYDEESFLFYGRSRGDSIDVDGKVYFATEEEVTPGDIIKVKILDADEYDLTGQAEVFDEYANKITMIRVVLVPIFMVLFMIDNVMCHYAALGVFVLASITDAIDGHVARKI